MGNAQSDAGECEAYERVIKHIPGLNAAYSSVRSTYMLEERSESAEDGYVKLDQKLR
jgi:hypothetical protein